MPRNIGTGLYKVPAGTDGVPDTTIESVKYNTYIHDVEKDLNDPRPILAGGTGANDANEALVNLRGEKAAQLVSSFADHLFYNGSFYCTSNTTDAPTTGAFTGWAISSDNPQDPPLNQNVVLYARSSRKSGDGDEVGRIYVREKISGTWTPWTINATGVALPSPPDNPPDGTLWWDSIGGALYIWYNDGDTKQWVITSPTADPRQFLLKAGDTMQGTLGLIADPTAPLHAASKQYVDARIAAIPPPPATDLSNYVAKTGQQTMAGALIVNQPVYSIHNGNMGTYYFSNTSGTKYLWYDGTNYTLAGGNLNVPASLNVSGGINSTGGDIHTYRSGATNSGAVFFGAGSTSYLYFDGSNWALSGGGQFSVTAPLVCASTVYASQNFQASGVNCVLAGNGGNIFLRPYGGTSGANEVQVTNAGTIQLFANDASFVPPSGVSGGFRCKDGTGFGVALEHFNILWASPYPYFYIGATQLGILMINNCDYRIKKDVVDLPGTWNAVKALRPIKYTHKEFTPPSAEKQAKETGKPFFANSNTECWGFLAHEIQETLTPGAVVGEKDAPDKIQSVDSLAIIAALTKALQEAMTRIEALEARV